MLRIELRHLLSLPDGHLRLPLFLDVLRVIFHAQAGNRPHLPKCKTKRAGIDGGLFINGFIQHIQIQNRKC